MKISEITLQDFYTAAHDSGADITYGGDIMFDSKSFEKFTRKLQVYMAQELAIEAATAKVSP